MGASLPPLRIPITTSGDAAVLGTFNRIGQAGGALEKQFARSALNVAALGNAAVQAGEVGGSALTKLTNIGASLALTMGIGGPVVAALGVAAITMVGFFTRARSEMEETRRTAEDELRKIRKSTDLAGLNAQATRLFAGDPEAVADPNAKNKKAAERRAEAERQGVERLRAERESITKRIQDLVMREIELRGKAEPEALAKVRKELAGVYVEQERNSALLAEVEPRFEAASKRAKEYGTVMGEVEEAARAMAERLKDADPAKRQEAIAKEVAALVSLAKLGKLRSEDLQAMAVVERVLTDEIARGNVTRERRAAIEQQLATLEQTRRDMFGTQGPSVDFVAGGLERRGQAPTVGPISGTAKNPIDMAQAEIMAQAEEFAKHDARQAGMVMGNAIVEGLGAAFSGGGIGNAFATFGGNLLSGLGRIFAEMGMKIGLFGKIMKALEAKIMANPLLAGGAAIVAGGLLMALGKSLGGTVRSGGAAGGAFGSSVSSASAATDSITNIRISTGAVDAATGLTPKQPLNVTIIGPNDPVAQRQLWELLDNGRTRGYGA